MGWVNEGGGVHATHAVHVAHAINVVHAVYTVHAAHAAHASLGCAGAHKLTARRLAPPRCAKNVKVAVRFCPGILFFEKYDTVFDL